MNIVHLPIKPKEVTPARANKIRMITSRTKLYCTITRNSSNYNDTFSCSFASVCQTSVRHAQPWSIQPHISVRQLTCLAVIIQNTHIASNVHMLWCVKISYFKACMGICWFKKSPVWWSICSRALIDSLTLDYFTNNRTRANTSELGHFNTQRHHKDGIKT